MTNHSKLASSMFGLAIVVLAVGMTTAADARDTQTVQGNVTPRHEWHPPVLGKGDKPSNGRVGGGGGLPETGLNCTYTTHGLCSQQ